MNALDRIAAQLAKPMTHAVVTTYSDGETKRHETRSAAQAETFAIGERRRIGRSFIRRDTGVSAIVIAVDVLPL